MPRSLNRTSQGKRIKNSWLELTESSHRVGESGLPELGSVRLGQQRLNKRFVTHDPSAFFDRSFYVTQNNQREKFSRGAPVQNVDLIAHLVRQYSAERTDDETKSQDKPLEKTPKSSRSAVVKRFLASRNAKRLDGDPFSKTQYEGAIFSSYKKHNHIK